MAVVKGATGGGQASSVDLSGAESLLQTLELSSRCSALRDRIRASFKSTDLAGMMETLEANQARLAEVDDASSGLPGSILEPSRIEKLKMDTTALGEAIQDASLVIATLESELRICQELLSEQRGFYERCRRDLTVHTAEAEDSRTMRDSLNESMATLEEEVAGLNSLVLETDLELEQLDVARDTVTKAYQAFLDRGGTEATVTDYPKTIGLRTPEPPLLPKRTYKPRVWTICLVAGILAFSLLCSVVVVSDRLSRSRTPEQTA